MTSGGVVSLIDQDGNVVSAVVSTPESVQAAQEAESRVQSLNQAVQLAENQTRKAFDVFMGELATSGILNTNEVRVLSFSLDRFNGLPIARQKELLVNLLEVLKNISSVDEISSHFQFRLVGGDKSVMQDLLADPTVARLISVLTDRGVLVDTNEVVTDSVTGATARELSLLTVGDVENAKTPYLPVASFDNEDHTTVTLREVFHGLAALLQDPENLSEAFVNQHLSFFSVGADVAEVRLALVAFLNGKTAPEAQAWAVQWALPILKMVDDALRFEQLQQAFDISA
jgi:hypothetical protein